MEESNPNTVNCTEIQKHTTEYDNVLYKLHLATRRSDSVADLSVWDIQNPHVAVKFDQASQNKLILDCFIDEETWGKQNTLESMLLKAGRAELATALILKSVGYAQQQNTKARFGNESTSETCRRHLGSLDL